MQQDIYTAEEAATYLGISRSRVLQFIRQKRLRATKHGGRIYVVYHADLEAFRAIPRLTGQPKKLIGKTP
jgi:excisionase family DNA binding protein